MAVTQYIGARYVPMFADPAEWDNSNAYEPLTIVTYQGNSYTSRQAVPIGIDITDEQFWVCSGNYNAQVEAYRKETVALAARIAALEAKLTNVNTLSESTTYGALMEYGFLHD